MGFWDRFRRREAARALPPPSRNGYYASSYGMPNAEKVDGGFDQFAQVAYAGNAVVFAVENRRMQVFSEAVFKFRSLSDKHLFGNEDLGKLEQPWPNGSTGDLLSRMEQDAAFSGNAYIRDAGDRLERLRPDWVTIVSEIHYDALGNEVREVIGYAYDPVGDTDREPDFFPVDEVAHWAPIPDPCANFRGMSWLTPIIREINSDVQMAAFRDAFFANAATANLIVKYEQKVTPERITALREMIATKHTGSTNAFGTLVFDEGGDPMIVGADMTGAAFDALQAAGETRIAAAGGVPAIVAGLRQGMQNSEPGEYQAASRALVDLTLRPLWRSACAALQKLVTVPAGAQLWYDTTDVSALQQGEKDKADTLAMAASTMNTWIMAGYTPESVTAAYTAADPSLLKHSGLVSVQMQQLSAPTGPPVTGKPPAGAPGDAAPKGPAARSRGVSRRFNPAEARDGHGRWTDGPGGAVAGAAKDVLKIADSIPLGDGERFEGSSRVRLPTADVRMALTREADGSPSLRFGVDSQLPSKWRGANGKYTVKLDRKGIDGLAAKTDELAKTMRDAERRADRMWAHIEEVAARVGEDPNKRRPARGGFDDPELNKLVAEFDDFTDESLLDEGSFDTPWGQLYYRAVITDTGAHTYLLVTKPGAKLTGNDALEDVRGYDDPARFDPGDMRKLAAALAKMRQAAAPPATRAVTSHRGNAEQLHHYWTRGEGLAKWAKSPHPWTALFEHLVKFMPPEEAKRTAAEWFHDVFHFWPGSDKNRVLHGHPPRGKRVGVG